MCGIVGYIGNRPAVNILLDGLRRLEYRGYDSAGVAILEEGDTFVSKSVGRLAALEAKLGERRSGGSLGIGHTRWATHGRPSDENAHPHADCTGRLTVVHNGIVENHQSLREELQAQGHRFESETDTEVIAHLLEEHYRGDLEAALREVMERIRGSFALAVVSSAEPDRLVAARQYSPLVIGLGRGENYLASDIPAVLPYTRDVYILNDGEMAVLTRDGVRISDRLGNRVQKEIYCVQWDAVAAEKGGFDHFMLKEIHEQPKAIRDTLTGRLMEGGAGPAGAGASAGSARAGAQPAPGGVRVEFQGLSVTPEQWRAFTNVAIVACGTASHAGLVGKYLIEKLVRIPVQWEVASEFRYREPLVDQHTLTVAISQSGETADTLAAMREARGRGSRVLAITNVVGSTIAREADDVIYTWAGPEIAVASTKAYTTQLVAMSLLALLLGQERGVMGPREIAPFAAELRALPDKAAQVLEQSGRIAELAQELAKWEDCFFIGRGLDHAVALEGQLKLKEISYLHAEAYPAGELKHGTLALITDGVPVIALATQPDLHEKTLSNIMEVRARGAKVIAVAREDDREIHRYADHVMTIPVTHPWLAPALSVLPLQLLAYYTAVARGCDVDKPRNLAKSVTVE